MYRAGQEEVDAVGSVIKSHKLFRYQTPPDESQCARFERRYAEYLSTKHVILTASGTASLTAALGSLGIGPGDEVIVPSHTFMATAVAVLAVGAIPVIVDVDQTLTLSPDALESAIGPRTRAAIPVHMWGVACDMNRIMDIAQRHNLLIVEDACQAVGGSYEGRKLGSIGHAGAFSFNFFKNMTCGEGGAFVTNDDRGAQVAKCMTDCCGFYWNGRESEVPSFTSPGSRASELEGAMLNAQLDRLDSMITAMRAIKKDVLRRTSDLPGISAAPANSIDHECGTKLLYQLESSAAADRFAALTAGTVAARTGRHTYTEWDPILARRAAHHPAMNPFNFPQNKGCRMDYSLDMCQPSLDILSRTVLLSTNPDWKSENIEAMLSKIQHACEVLATAPASV